MLVDRDHDGWYEWCLQCGYRHELIGTIKVRPQAKVEKGVAENAWEERDLVMRRHDRRGMKQMLA